MDKLRELYSLETNKAKKIELELERTQRNLQKQTQATADLEDTVASHRSIILSLEQQVRLILGINKGLDKVCAEQVGKLKQTEVLQFALEHQRDRVKT